MAKQKNKSIVSGRNIYQDEKGRNILYNKNSGVGYLIQEKDEKSYSLYKNRYLYVIIGIILAVNFLANIWICLGIGVIAALFLEYKYRANFLPQLVQITNFKPYKNLSALDQMVSNGNPQKILISAILYIALSVLLILNGIEMQLDTIFMIANIALSIAALIFAGFHLVAFYKIKKSN